MTANPPGISYHEWVHANACRGEGDWYRWVACGDEQVVEGYTGSSKASLERSAVELCAGALAGGGDHQNDWDAAAGLAAEAGTPMDQIEARASRYLDRSAYEREAAR